MQSSKNQISFKNILYILICIVFIGSIIACFYYSSKNVDIKINNKSYEEKVEVELYKHSVLGQIKELGYKDELKQTSKITVAIFDTGVNNIPDIDGKIVFFKDFINEKSECYDDNGHGTAVTAIIASNGISSSGVFRGIAPNTNIIMLKLFDENGKTNMLTIEKGLEWILENKNKYKIKILCMPLGYGSFDSINSDPLYHKLKELINNNILIVAAAGNNGILNKKVDSPGLIPEVLCVGALDMNYKDNENRNLREADFSPSFFTRQLTGKPDVFAPGVDIIPYGKNNNLESYKFVSGTSFSTAIVTGLAAIIYEKNPDITNKYVYKIIKDTSNKNGIVSFNKIDKRRVDNG